MPRVTPEEREYRRELLSHMHHCHGGYSNGPGERWTIEQLETIHQMMHVDQYACPPHEHKKIGPFDLGKIKLKLGKGYVDMLKKEVRG